MASADIIVPETKKSSNNYNSNKNLNILSNSGLGNYRNNGGGTNSVTSGNKPMTGQKSVALVPDLDDLEDMEDIGAAQK